MSECSETYDFPQAKTADEVIGHLKTAGCSDRNVSWASGAIGRNTDVLTYILDHSPDKTAAARAYRFPTVEMTPEVVAHHVADHARRKTRAAARPLMPQPMPVREEPPPPVSESDYADPPESTVPEWESTEEIKEKTRDGKWRDRVFTMNQIREMVFPPKIEYVPQLITKGLTLIAAKPKVGKTFLMLDIGVGIATGGTVLGKLQCLQAPVLIVSYEDPLERMHNRDKSLFPDPIDCPDLHIVPMGQWPSAPDGFDLLAEYLDDYPEIKVVFIDVLKAYRGAGDTGDGSLTAEDYASLKSLQEMAFARELAIIVLCHNRKAEADDPQDMISGTLGYAGASDHNIVMYGSKTAGTKLYMVGRDLPDVHWNVDLDRAGHWVITGDVGGTGSGGPSKKEGDAEKRRQVLMMRDDGASVRMIEEATGVPSSTVQRIITAATDKPDRDAKIIALLSAGTSPADIVRKLKCTVATVKKVQRDSK